MVYRRIEAGNDAAGPGAEGGPSFTGWRQLAPTLWPLMLGFLILLVLVFLLGVLSERELENMRSGVGNAQLTLDGRTDLYTRTLAAAERLNTEARLRADREARKEVLPPLAVNVSNARNELNEQIDKLNNPSLMALPSWAKLRKDLQTFSDSTKELSVYAAQGFVLFRDLREDFDVVSKELQAERTKMDAAGEDLRQRAVRRVRLLWVTALILGFLVVAGTVAEVQKRFREVNRSVENARRERRFSTQILEGMVSAVAAIDARGRVRSANGVFMEIFPSAKVGVSVHGEIALNESLGSLEAAIAQPVKEATYFGRCRVSVATRAEAERTFDVYSSPIEIDNEQGRIVTLVDVTDAVDAETVMRRNEALAAVGQASAQLAHEIKNPLGSIRLGVSILRDMTDKPDALNTIDLVERGIEHLNKLVVDVTQFSRQRPLNITPVQLDDLLDVSLMLVEDRIQDKDIKVVRDLAEPVQGRWDEDQLTQVFVNLLANGIDASSEGAPVSVSTRKIAESRLIEKAHPSSRTAVHRDYVRVVIEDTGSGMDAATRAKIFEPFYTTKKRGTGLGLAVVKQIVEQHEGAIAVESEPGKGTRFIIELPLVPHSATLVIETPIAEDQVAVSDANA